MNSLNNLNRQNKNSTIDITDGFEGFEILSQIVSKYMKAAENPTEALIAGAKAIVADTKKLGKPMSEIRKSGYTHLVKSFDYEKRGKEVVVGWKKYYGRMVENGTTKMSARRHLRPLFENNKEKYYKVMLKTLGLQTW